MAYTNAWDETAPAGTDAISSGDDEIRQFKLDIRERLNSLLASTAALTNDLDPLVLAESITQGDGAAEDLIYILNGIAQDFYWGLDDSADDFLIGVGNTMGTTPAIGVDENADVRIGAAGTQDGQMHLLSGSTAQNALVVEVPTSTSAEAIEWHYNGVVRGQIRANATVQAIGLAEIDLGNNVAGTTITLNRNSNGTQSGAGQLRMQDKGATLYYVHPDDAGLLRIGTTDPTGSSDTSNGVVGDQTSFQFDPLTGKRNKIELGKVNPKESLELISKTKFHLGEYAGEENSKGLSNLCNLIL